MNLKQEKAFIDYLELGSTQERFSHEVADVIKVLKIVLKLNNLKLFWSIVRNIYLNGHDTLDKDFNMQPTGVSVCHKSLKKTNFLKNSNILGLDCWQGELTYYDGYSRQHGVRKSTDDDRMFYYIKDQRLSETSLRYL